MNPFGNGNGGNKGSANGGNDIPRPPAEQKPGSCDFPQQVPAGGLTPFKDPAVAPGVPQVAGNGPKPFKITKG